MKSPTKRTLPIVSALVLISLTSTGCRSVAPWERSILAGYNMNADRDPLRDSLAEHMFFSREAASGGRGVGGGGCGCN